MWKINGSKKYFSHCVLGGNFPFHIYFPLVVVEVQVYINFMIIFFCRWWEKMSSWIHSCTLMMLPLCLLSLHSSPYQMVSNIKINYISLEPKHILMGETTNETTKQIISLPYQWENTWYILYTSDNTCFHLIINKVLSRVYFSWLVCIFRLIAPGIQVVRVW